MRSAASGTAAPVTEWARRRVLAVLCVTEIVSWGVLYYAFPVLAAAIAADTGWRPDAAAGAFSAALVVSAVVGVPVGRWLDRWGPRVVMTAGSVLAVPAMVLVARAPSFPWFLAGWLLAGVAMAGVLYAPAFAALTRWWGPRRVTALTILTLAAGLSSTVFAPLTAALLEARGWRGALLALAVVLAVTTVPAHLFGLRGPWPAVEREGPGPGGDDPGAIARSRPFLLLTSAMALAAFAAYAVLVNQVALLLERGLDTATAALALGLGGVGQVLGRLGFGGLAARTGVRARTAGIIAACAVTTALFAVVPGPAALLVGVAVVTGAARGLFTLVQATAVSDRWGAAHYGRLNGLLGGPALVATAVAPWAGTALAGPLGGWPAVFGVLAGVAGLAALLAVTARVPAGPGP
ncbi:MAG TPA: MFS transporter [Pseudonocardia sp.]|nr:MFS transporter [Pseudonocardia sp.]